MSEITLTKEAAVRQREALRLLTEENEALRRRFDAAQKEAAARNQLSKEATDRLAGALVTAGYIRAADQAKTASLIASRDDSFIDIVERMAAERAAPPAMGTPERQTKQASEQPRESADDVWNSGPWGSAGH